MFAGYEGYAYLPRRPLVASNPLDKFAILSGIKKMVGCTTITEINEATGEPLAPGQIKTTFVNQLGYLVRESVPIKYKL